MKVKVNKDICIGCGACTSIASEIFEIGNDGLAEAIVNVVADKDKENVTDAYESCPVSAIELTEE